MQKLTLSQFIAESGLNASLVRSTVHQCGGWEMFQDTARNLQYSSCGALGGIGGFIYYSETVAFTKRNKKAILEMCKDQASDYYGHSMTIPGFIAGFNCVDCDAEQVAIALYTGKGDCVTAIYNALAWYALEEVSRRYCDILESFS
jgi:hypothetical protein